MPVPCCRPEKVLTASSRPDCFRLGVRRRESRSACFFDGQDLQLAQSVQLALTVRPILPGELAHLISPLSDRRFKSRRLFGSSNGQKESRTAVMGYNQSYVAEHRDR